jgi:hypothetical protein
MLKRLNRWIGRHMSAKRWCVAWVILCLTAMHTLGVVAGIGRYSALEPIAAIVALISAFMFIANLRRLE